MQRIIGIPAFGLTRLLPGGLLPVGLMFGSLMLGGCSGETLFQSSFNATQTNQPPAHNQATGTASVAGDPGSVVVKPLPNSTEKAVQISRAGTSQAINVLTGTLSQVKGAGTYGLIALINIPSVSPPRRTAMSVELDATMLGLRGPILHLDFMNDCANSGQPGANTVRINDTPGYCFGTFPNDRPFVLQVTLHVGTGTASADVQLVGAGGMASGSASNIPIQYPSLARQFGSVAFWMGYPWSGAFDVTDIVVTYRKPGT
ncbi:MAG: hypothetical protein JSR91_04875 [Proteobacteria bacterium]|nr:hypothetical protein [Pseudomonadota bacterium]